MAGRRWLWIGGVTLGTLAVIILTIIFWPFGEDSAAVTPTTVAASIITPTMTVPVTATVIVEVAVPTAAVEEVTLTATPNAPAPEAAPTIANLLTNGDFSQNWDVGWERELGENVSGSQRTEVIEVGRGQSGRGVHIERNGADTLELWQTVGINPAQMRFQGQVRLIGSADDATDGEGMAVLMLIYRGAEATGSPLGYSLWVNGSQRESTLFGQGLLPQLGPNVSLRWIGEEWTTIEVDLRQEIINSLPLVKPDEVQQITVTLLTIGSESCAPAGCAVDILATDLVLTQE